MINKIVKTIIGTDISNSTANSVLYIDTNKKLAEDNSDFSYDGINKLSITNVEVSGTIAVGVSVDPNIYVKIDKTSSQSVASANALQAFSRQDIATAAAVIGMNSAAIAEQTSGTIADIIGYQSNTQANTDFPVTNVTALDAQIPHANAKTATIFLNRNLLCRMALQDTASSFALGVQIQPFTKNTGSVTNVMGILAQAQTIGSNNWSIVAEGDVQLNNDIRFMLSGAATSGVKGTTYLVYNSSTTDLDLFVDNTKVMTFDNDGTVSHKDMTHSLNTVYTPSATTNITAAGGITVTNTEMHIQGDGGAITITANPQIVAGVNGQMVYIEGQSNTNTVTIQSGNGVHLHGKAIIGEHDMLVLHFEAGDSEWQEVTRNFYSTDKFWHFTSPLGSSGTTYADGWYEFGASDNDFNPSITLGTANKSEAAHFFLVQAAGGGGGTDTVIRITGTTINDNGTRATGQTVDVTVDDAGSVGDYYETTEKWLGQVTIVKLSGPDLLMNYGFVKYWDNNNSDFKVNGLEATWLGGANDAGTDIILRHHKSTGWTYNNGAAPTPPTALAQMTIDHSTDSQTRNGENHAWKRVNLNTAVEGSGSEGMIIEIITTANKAFEGGTFILTIRSQ